MVVQEKYLVYLDQLRESGVTNMFGAGEYLEAQFNLSRKEAKEILIYWIKTFDKRHRKEG